MDLWLKARSFAEEAAKRSQEFTVEAAKRTQELSIGSAKLSDVVSEASKRSKEIAAQASKRSKEIVAEASKRADQIKFQIPAAAALSSLVDSSTSPQTASAITTPADLEKFGVTDDLREFVKGITRDTFQNVQLQGTCSARFHAFSLCRVLILMHALLPASLDKNVVHCPISRLLSFNL